MGIDGVIIIDNTGRPIVQTAFKSGTTAVAAQHVDALNNAYEAAANQNQSVVDPIIFVDSSLGPSVCCNVQHNSLRIACPVHSETDPLFVLAFLQTLLDVLQEYLGDISATSIRENFDIVYQLLEEMLDSGYPSTTELNTLREIVTPPSLFKKILAVAGSAGLTKAVSTPFSSPIPWRATGLRYNNNEIFFDIVEEMQGTISKEGKSLNVEVWGRIRTNTRLSGTPDILLTLNQPQVLSDCSFHPCVRLPRWMKDKVISFVPPDGRFILMDYRLTSPTASSTAFTVPFTLKASVELLEGSNNVDLTFQPRFGLSKGLEGVLIEWSLGQGVTSTSWIPSGGGGTYSFDARSGILQWQIPAASGNTACTLRGTYSTSTPAVRPSPSIQMDYTSPSSF
ncbi:hypothetical protein FRC18_001303 [Serendipita sp. 400]|nr:hypothetical protein FRC18_001303 [Serendipita sp. 400]